MGILDEWQRLRKLEKALEKVKSGVIRNHYVWGEDRCTFRFGFDGDGEERMAALREAFDLTKGRYLATFVDEDVGRCLPGGALIHYLKGERGITPELRDKMVVAHREGIETMNSYVKILEEMQFNDEGELIQ